MSSVIAAKQQTQTLTDLVYSQLRGDILSGELSPGLKLRVEHLKARYNMGASPIREALSRLTGDSLVSAEGRRGFRVADVSLAELWDITELRVLLETRALRLSIEAGDDHWEAEVLASFHRLSKLDDKLSEQQPGEEWESRHRDFHANLVAASASPWLLDFRGIMFEQSERYRRLALAQSSAERDVAGEHRSIMEAALDRDAENACALLADHVRRTAEIVAKSTLVSS
jgi:DNA-binding GntR family transcriptional regulator